MNTKKIICLLALCLSFAIMPSRVLAEERNIYIGDIITLQITPQKLSAEEIAAEFRDFEIIEIKEENGVYFVSLRTFDTGEYKIYLGGREISINVRSTLEDINRDDIFEGEKRVAEPGVIIYWRIFFCIFAGIFILSGGFFLFKKIIGKKINAPEPLRLFLSRSGSIPEKDENYFVELTYHFKRYLEELYKFKIVGKTSVEIVNELKTIKAFENILPDIRDWLAECDRMKFTGIRTPIEEKRGHYIKLCDLAQKINMQKEGAP